MATLLALTVTSGAAGQDLDFLVSPGPLADVHSELSGLMNCSRCHSPGKGVEEAKCLECHNDLATRIQAGRGFHRDKASGCFPCHPDHQGENARLVSWHPEAFDHTQTGHPLAGLHLEVDSCGQCHRPALSPPREKTTSFLLNDTRCIACHTDDHNGQLGADCQKCHSLEVKFNDLSSFDHDRTVFPLRGPHQAVACDQCHLDKQWKDLGSRCVDCHRDSHQPSLGSDCERCHQATSWIVPTFDHSRTRYPLGGLHRSVDCADCHQKKVFKNLAFARCDDCHKKDPHVGQFETDCQSCHTVNGFKPALFAHQRSDYPLTGKHQSVNCDACHRREEGLFPAGYAQAVRYVPLETACRSCHEDVHRGQFETDCQSCHTVNGFKPALFAHEQSGYPLTGKHQSVDCTGCHRREEGLFPIGYAQAVRYVPLETACRSCHEDVHLGQLDKTCTPCHRTEGFQHETLLFQHNRHSRFRLEGRHLEADCTRCHKREVGVFPVGSGETVRYQPLLGQCSACHENIHDPLWREPKRERLGAQCDECHNSESFTVTGFDHSRTSLPLNGKHKSVACEGCHEFVHREDKKRLFFRDFSEGCATCHPSPHEKKQKDCATCHTTMDWRVSAW